MCWESWGATDARISQLASRTILVNSDSQKLFRDLPILSLQSFLLAIIFPCPQFLLYGSEAIRYWCNQKHSLLVKQMCILTGSQTSNEKGIFRQCHLCLCPAYFVESVGATEFMDWMSSLLGLTYENRSLGLMGAQFVSHTFPKGAELDLSVLNADSSNNLTWHKKGWFNLAFHWFISNYYVPTFCLVWLWVLSKWGS